MGWENMYEYMLHEQGMALCWQQHYQYNPAPLTSNLTGQNVKELWIEA